ncbi:MAG: hypothetical protein AAGF97_19130, partial [Planctomycetota bacterium]
LSTVWFCCQGSLLQTVAEYHNLIYFRDDDSLYVNLFVPSQVNWNRADGRVTLVQETRFPNDGEVCLKFRLERPVAFGLKFRVPRWSQSPPKVTLNNEPITLQVLPGSWALIERTWSSEDVVAITWDLTPRAEPITGYVSPVAVMCGPVAMVQTTARGAIPGSGPLRFPADYLTVRGAVSVDPARNLHTNQEFRPYYDVQLGEYYRIYFNRGGRRAVPLESFEFIGPWRREGIHQVCDEAGASFAADFEGTGVVWEGRRDAQAGVAEVAIDGEVVADVDQYGYTGVHVGRMDQREVPFRWSYDRLSPGKHTLEVRVTGRGHERSTGTSINVTGLSAYP